MGIDKSTDVICYCGGGISATVDLFMLHQLGYDRITLYDGSMGEWGQRRIIANRNRLVQGAFHHGAIVDFGRPYSNGRNSVSGMIGCDKNKDYLVGSRGSAILSSGLRMVGRRSRGSRRNSR
jgi:hypothetical protein